MLYVEKQQRLDYGNFVIVFSLNGISINRPALVFSSLSMNGISAISRTTEVEFWRYQQGVAALVLLTCPVMSSSLVKRLEFGPAPPRGVTQGPQSPQGGVKILL